MGDKIYFKTKCAYCGKQNPAPCDNLANPSWEDDYICYAESCGETTFKCGYCGKENRIKQIFKAVKL